MKKLISQNSGFKIYAEVDKVGTTDGKSYLKFLTEYDDAKIVDQQQKFIMFLSEEERKTLKDLL